MVVKTRKQGNSVVLSVPKEIKVDLNKEFEVFQEEDGAIIFLPVHKNIYKENPDYDFRGDLEYAGIIENNDLKGKENVEY
ncbi:MAG: AbrB family transcriptional regulator [Lactobacillales bacterium]|jgi:virulence-associated protein VagC|nr:AbrB family transcriptional regulator [Lactobacillales bacterium]